MLGPLGSADQEVRLARIGASCSPSSQSLLPNPSAIFSSPYNTRLTHFYFRAAIATGRSHTQIDIHKLYAGHALRCTMLASFKKYLQAAKNFTALPTKGTDSQSVQSANGPMPCAEAPSWRLLLSRKAYTVAQLMLIGVERG